MPDLDGFCPSCGWNIDAQTPATTLLLQQREQLLAKLAAVRAAVRPVVERYSLMLANEECDCTFDGGVHTCAAPDAEAELGALRRALDA